MLGSEELRARLTSGTLVIDPIDQARDVGGPGIDIRIGPQYAAFVSLDLDTTKPHTKRAEIGDEIVIPPRSGIIASSLEYVSIPRDLMGILMPRASLGRLGIIVSGSSISPGFQGIITFPVANLSDRTVRLVSGMRAASLLLDSVEGEIATAAMKYEPTLSSREGRFDNLEPLRQMMQEAATAAKAKQHSASLAQVVRDALEAPQASKGKLLEKAAVRVLQTVEGLHLLGSNVRGRAEEFDIVFQNDAPGFWRHLGPVIFVECKNSADKVGAPDITVLTGKLQAHGPDAKTAILVAPAGVTGRAGFDGWLKVRDARAAGKVILVVDRDALQNMISGAHPSDVLESAFRDYWFI